MYFIDIHNHVYPEAIAQKAIDSIRDFYGIHGADMSGTAEMLLSRGKEAGISKFAVLPVSIRPDRVRSINNFILSQTAQHEEFIGFGTVHADMEHLLDEVQYILDNGLRGIKLHADTQGFPIDDPRLYPVYEAISGRIPVLLHMGDRQCDYSHPVRLRKLMGLFPKLDVIAAHLGGYTMYEEAHTQLKDTSCVLDLSSSLMFLERGEVERYINSYGAERIAYATDYPLWDPVEEMERFLKLQLTVDQFEQIAHKTAERVLKL